MRRSHSLTWYWNRFKSYIGRPRMVVQVKPVVIDDGQRCDRPIFIIGVHRSGTSLVRRLFNAHPEIACPPESFFIAHYADMLAQINVRAGYEGLGYDREAMRQDLANKASSLHEAFRIATGKSVWADKTPQYVDKLDAIDALFDAKARFVLVLRHPSDVVYSIFKRNWRFNDIADGFESALIHVRDGIGKILDFERRNGDRCVRINYRELCDKPENVLREVMARLDLEFDPVMLDFAEKNHNFGLEDPVIRGTRAIKRSAGAWRGLNSAQQGRLVEHFGARALQETFWDAD